MPNNRKGKRHISGFSTFLVLIVYAALSNITFSAHSSNIPILEASKIYQNGSVSLNGEWGFYWGAWIPLDQIHSNNFDIEKLSELDFLSKIVANQGSEKNQFFHGYGTYLLEIEGLNQIFTQPAIHMRNISEAWQAWWVDDNGTIRLLGESGKISKDLAKQEVRYKNTILDLPNNSAKGTLVIYLSSHMFGRAGFYGNPVIEEHSQANRNIYRDIVSRTLLLGMALFVVVQSLMFYRQRPKEYTLLLLAVFAFVILLRGLVASDYFYVIVGDPSMFDAILKLEYILIIWPAVAGAHYFSHLVAFRWSKLFIQTNYAIFVVTVLITLFLTSSQMMFYLPYYQATLLILALGVLVVIGSAFFTKPKGFRLLILSLVPLVVAIFNDIYATNNSHYNVFIVEYSLFLFLFIQSQIQTSRFITALNNEEHLTNNLQVEIDLKTQELSLHNQILENKAIDLEAQRNQIKAQSKIDHLTGLFNRKTLDEYSAKEFIGSKIKQLPLSVAMMDIDNFKRVNDEYGHAVGDHCLKFVARYLTNSKLRKDDIVARYGGEEMLILFANTDLKEAEAITIRICEGLSKAAVEGDHPPITLTASFGVAERITSRVESIEDLIDEADKALYIAKREGKNRVEVSSEPR